MRPLRWCGRRRWAGTRSALIAAGLAAVALLIGCSSDSSSSSPTAPAGTSPAAQTSPVAPEINPPGDIPDNQVFVSYHSTAGGYSLQVPEGWARSESGTSVSFVDKLDSVTIEVAPATTAPTIDTVTQNELPRLQQQVEAFEQVVVAALDLPAGAAVRIRYRANSAPDAVTGKQVRLEIDRYELFKDGKSATLSLSAPAGSDNVDVWNQISRSFAWD